MNKKELYQNNLSIAYSSGFNKLKVKVSPTKPTTKFTPFLTLGDGKKKYHKLRIYSLDNFIKI